MKGLDTTAASAVARAGVVYTCEAEAGKGGGDARGLATTAASAVARGGVVLILDSGAGVKGGNLTGLCHGRSPGGTENA